MRKAAQRLGSSVALLRPDLIIRSVIAAFGPYLLCCGCLYAAAYLWNWAIAGVLPEGSNVGFGIALAAAILTSIGGVCITLYAMRIVGLFYRHYKHRLAWAFE